jgi:hypothetical protein
MKRILLLASIVVLAPAILRAEIAGDVSASWSRRIDQLHDDLKVRLANAENRLNGLKAKIETKAQDAEQEASGQLDDLRKRIEQGRAKLSEERADIKEWTEEQKKATGAKIAEWKAKHELKELQGRADRERYAAASINAALAAIDEAEHATLEAWLARRDAIAAQAQ